MFVLKIIRLQLSVSLWWEEAGLIPGIIAEWQDDAWTNGEPKQQL